MKRLKKKESVDPFYALRDNTRTANADCNDTNFAYEQSAVATDNGMLGGARRHLPLLNNFTSIPSHAITNNNMNTGHVVYEGSRLDSFLRPGVSDVQSLVSQAQIRQLMEQNALMNHQLQLQEANNAALFQRQRNGNSLIQHLSTTQMQNLPLSTNQLSTLQATPTQQIHEDQQQLQTIPLQSHRSQPGQFPSLQAQQMTSDEQQHFFQQDRTGGPNMF